MNERLSADATVDRDYLVLLIAAAIVASLGLEQNSPATIIGAMVVAPLMLPIRALGYGLIRFDAAILGRSLLTLVSSILLVIAIGAAVGWISQRPEFGTEITSRTSVTFLGLAVALAGGTLAGLSRSLGESKITDSLVGVGISVSLVPPLCSVGITFAYGIVPDALGAFMLFLTNLVGISLACGVVFVVTGNASKQNWRTAAGFAAFAAAVAAISPVLAQAGYRAKQLSAVENFMVTRAGAFVPSLVSVESTQIAWAGAPYEILTTVRTRRTPTRAQVRALNDAVNRELPEKYHLTLVVDPAVTIFP
jgi:uncharacterized hydrophobic protein (TIGR00271 family)